MENYNFTPKNLDDINLQKSVFLTLLLDQSKDLLELELLFKKDIEFVFKNFWSIFIDNHLEIRSNIRLTRYFILKKNDKLSKELNNELFMKTIYVDLMEKTKIEYWKFLHTAFLLFEIAHKDKNDAIINTLTSELEKLLQEEQLLLANEELKEQKESNKNTKKKMGRLIKKKDNIDMFKNFDLKKMMSMFGNIASGTNSDKPEDLLNGMMEELSKADPDMADKMSKLTAQMSDKDDNKQLDMKNIMKTFMPNMDDNKNEDLMKDMMKDITSTMSNITSTDDVFNKTKQLGEKYQTMIVDGKIDPNEILGSLMGLMTDDNFNAELSKIDVSQIKPEDMLGKMMNEVSPELLNQVVGNNSGDIGSMLSGVISTITGSQNNVTEKPKDIQLTQEQLNELEEYYARLNINAEIDDNNNNSIHEQLNQLELD